MLATAKPSALVKAENRVSEIRSRLGAANEELSAAIAEHQKRPGGPAAERVQVAQSSVQKIEIELAPARVELAEARSAAGPQIASATDFATAVACDRLLQAADLLADAGAIIDAINQWRMRSGLGTELGYVGQGAPTAASLRSVARGVNRRAYDEAQRHSP